MTAYLKVVADLGWPSWAFALGLAGLVAYGAWLRFAELGAPSFWLDEAVSVMQSRGILEYGEPVKPDGTVDWTSFSANYWTALGLRLFKDLHVGARFFSALAGTVCIGLTGWAAWSFFGCRIAAFAASLLVAVSTDQVMWSRQVRPYIFLQLYFLLAVVLAHQCSHRFGWGRFTALGVFAFLGVGAHRAGYLVPLVCFGIVALPLGRRLWAACKRRSWKWVLGTMFALLLAASAALWGLWHVAGNASIPALVSGLANPYHTDYTGLYVGHVLRVFGTAGILTAAVGALYWLSIEPMRASAWMLGAGVYFIAIARHTWMYADRYSFPLLLPIVILWSAGVAGLALRVMAMRTRPMIRHVVLAGLLVSVLGATLAQANTTWKPKRLCDLGSTVPTPDWRSAFGLVAEREKMAEAPDRQVNIVTPYPVLQDVYGPPSARKLYLPINFCGHADGVCPEPPHTRADIVHTLAQLLATDGYLILDEFALRMIGDPAIAEFVRRTPPNACVASKDCVFIWLLGKSKTKLPELTSEVAIHD
jgi:hypothetical protein